jgi:hypothetical protein
MIRRRSRSDDGTAGPNRVKTKGETPLASCVCLLNEAVRGM